MLQRNGSSGEGSRDHCIPRHCSCSKSCPSSAQNSSAPKSPSWDQSPTLSLSPRAFLFKVKVCESHSFETQPVSLHDGWKVAQRPADFGAPPQSTGTASLLGARRPAETTHGMPCNAPSTGSFPGSRIFCVGETLGWRCFHLTLKLDLHST